MYTRLSTLFLAIFSSLCLSQIALLPSVSVAADQKQASNVYQISEVKTVIDPDNISMILVGNTPPAYTVSERFGPYRLIVDVADAAFASSLDLERLLPPNKLAKLYLSVLKDQQPTIARFEFTLDDNSSYDVQRLQNSLKINIIAPLVSSAPSSAPAAESAAASPDAPKAAVAESIFETPAKDIGLTKPQEEAVNKDVEQLKDSFSFSGYKNERISVDFYKIDLHNVFRLFRQITDLNIIVDEAVNGSVTIALKDVPWDFALDIILNLADLKKEERYNTLVIYPKSKEFTWPAQAVDNLTFEADTEVVREEALIIQQSASQPAEIMQAKELLLKARAHEKDDDYEDAAALYEKAAKLWPDNTKISNKLANLYLGRLNMNAKAYYFAQLALDKNPGDTRAALYSAISLANMDRIPEAMEFFAQSISGDPPMKEALVSYAAFSENNNQPEAALKLLNTYGKYYGEDLLSMVSKARILDKIGEREKATEQYRALMNSGFQMRPDLKKYVESRLSAGNF